MLGELEIHEDNLVRVCIVGASKGYPGDVKAVKGKRIYGVEKALHMKGVRLYGAGIAVQDGKFYAAGGRLFSIVGEGGDILEARARAMEAMSVIHIEGNNLQFRTDIAHHDIERFYKRLEP